MLREISNAQVSIPGFERLKVLQPSLGTSLIIVANAVLLIVLAFYKLDTIDQYSYQNIAYRAGFLSLGQLPLIFLLAGKNNVIGWLTGSSYERLNVLHRWTARCLLLMVTLHMAYWFADWAPYGYISIQMTTDSTTQLGFSAWCVLLWIVVSSMLPIRALSYEFFVIQHLISFVVFIVLILLHTPSSDHAWIYVGIGIFALDRITRAVQTAYVNVAIFHPESRRQATHSCLWASPAELTPLSHETTRVTIRNPPISWKPGQHAFISLHSMLPLQSHPFTISSISSDGKLEFLIKAHNGGTRKLFRYAKQNHTLPHHQNSNGHSTISIGLEGPYGQMRPLRQFESVVLLCGNVGATFTVPLLRDLVQDWKSSPQAAVTRYVRFVWIIKSQNIIDWFARELSRAAAEVRDLKVQGLDIRLDVSVYVTCGDNFNAGYTSDGSTIFSDLSSQSNNRESRSRGDVVFTTDEKDQLSPVKKTNNYQQDFAVREIDPRLESSSPRRRIKTCRPDGTCCCQTTIKDETSDAVPVAVVCSCSHDTEETQDVILTADDSADCGKPTTSSQPILDPSIHLLSGRPDLINIVRKTLEQAQGEAAVVVCGPRTLNESARQVVVNLSDERAIHKGTGALGVWFWSEGFGY